MRSSRPHARASSSSSCERVGASTRWRVKSNSRSSAVDAQAVEARGVAREQVAQVRDAEVLGVRSQCLPGRQIGALVMRNLQLSSAAAIALGARAAGQPRLTTFGSAGPPSL